MDLSSSTPGPFQFRLLRVERRTGVRHKILLLLGVTAEECLCVGGGGGGGVVVYVSQAMFSLKGTVPLGDPNVPCGYQWKPFGNWFI